MTWLAVLANLVKVAEAGVVLYGVFQYVANREERRAAERSAALLARKSANFQAWQVVNSAHGKGGSGGRIDALQDLKTNGVSLAGVHLDRAWLEGVDLSEANLAFATFVGTNLQGGNLERADLHAADLTDATLIAARLNGAVLKGANLAGARLSTADLRGADLAEIQGWSSIKSISYANLDGIRNAPPGFRDWALQHGAQEGREAREPDAEVEQGFSSSWRIV
jgi:uncharacterized protein YjbI with pentapeptide repeats